MRDLTEAQKRALEWLPADGGFRVPDPDDHYMRLDLLALLVERPDLLEGYTWNGFRLIAAGIALKAQIRGSND